MTKNYDVMLPGAMYRSLYKHLFPGDHDEHGALIATSVVTTERGVRLLGQRLFCARDGIDYVKGVRSHRQLRAEFIATCMDYCRANRLGFLAVHNHGGTNKVAFSSTDLASHERGYPTLLELMEGQPVGALVFATQAAAGDLWFPDGRRVPLRSVRVIDFPMEHLTPEPTHHCAQLARYHRQVLMFGELGQARLADCRVAIIGLGGVGSILVEFLARLGVGTLIVIDPDRLDVTNLSRVVGATRWHARCPFSALWMPTSIRKLAARCSARKTQIAKHLAHEISRNCKVITHSDNVANKSVANRCRDCDFIFLAADSMQARLAVNALTQQYLIPGLQIGSKVVTADSGKQLQDAYSVVRWLLPGSGCFWCNGLISPQRLAWEAKTDREQLDQQYGVQARNPSVLPLNAVGAAHAVARFMSAYLGLNEGRLHTDLRVHHLSSEICHDLPRQDSDCPECSGSGRLGRGDTRSLPTLPN